MTATLGNPNFTGAYLTMCFPFAYLLLGSKSVTKAVIIFLFGIAILLTQSRGSMGVFLFIVVLMALPYRHFPLVLFGSITIGAVLIFGILYRQPSLFDNRLLIWQRGIEAFRQKPIFGWGLENFDAAFQSTLSNKPYDYDLREIRVDKAHNEFIEVAVASGIFSLITYISLLIVSLRTLLRRRDQLLVRMSLFSFVAFIFLSSVNVVSISAYYVFYIILGYASHTHDNPNDMYIERHSAKN
ncbi:O-antigen ligase family protein [Candidatus Woesebacteria bacterium]|nr:O-antigen ligase family protein [Candidatus Woesebacteria bacterium]